MSRRTGSSPSRSAGCRRGRPGPRHRSADHIAGVLGGVVEIDVQTPFACSDVDQAVLRSGPACGREADAGGDIGRAAAVERDGPLILVSLVLRSTVATRLAVLRRDCYRSNSRPMAPLQRTPTRRRPHHRRNDEGPVSVCYGDAGSTTLLVRTRKECTPEEIWLIQAAPALVVPLGFPAVVFGFVLKMGCAATKSADGFSLTPVFAGVLQSATTAP